MTERPVAVLWAGEVWTVEAFARRVHPGNPLPIPAELSTAVRLMSTPLHPHGCDGSFPAAVAPSTAAAGLSTHHNN